MAAAKGGEEQVPPNGRFHGHRLLDFLAQLGNSFAAVVRGVEFTSH